MAERPGRSETSSPVAGARGFVCANCGTTFTLKAETLARYPGWQPKKCFSCRRPRNGEEPNRTRAEVLAQFDAGPATGVFTDGSCEGNPGPGGWGAVKVIDGKVLDERHGDEADTTNNRMELTALIEGYEMLDAGEGMPVFSDSLLAVNTITKWAAAWERNGWTRGRRREEVKNLELVQELYSLAGSHPKVELQWVKGHAGLRWNEYADSLSRAYQREEL
ncbi:MAG: ribonuclease HI [Chloroflexi bacterium]|nr:ribonuclease HI [Chloroflexota bacterium]